jgi:hypothetical protein
MATVVINKLEKGEYTQKLRKEQEIKFSKLLYLT